MPNKKKRWLISAALSTRMAAPHSVLETREDVLYVAYLCYMWHMCIRKINHTHTYVTHLHVFAQRIILCHIIIEGRRALALT